MPKRRSRSQERLTREDWVKAAWEVVRDVLREAAFEPEGVPGMVASLQTFGSFGANFHPHLRALVTEGVITPGGRFHPVIWPRRCELEQRFRRRFLERLQIAKGLSTMLHAAKSMRGFPDYLRGISASPSLDS